MLIKIFLKIWPALIPIVLFLIYKLIVVKLINRIKNKNKTIEGEKIVGNSSTNPQPRNPEKFFDLNDKNLIIILYLSIITMILCLIILAFN
ncbi:hypothetical protein LBMAG18_07900 [Alphaproteobacteria bacterium]|nr:hypothetical protein LBMAG18_07900 [Alphaproteobacteria bacterium]